MGKMIREPFKIVFNDEYIVVLNKIAKIVVCPTPKKEKRTLTTLLESAIKEKVFACHRLDRETTGLIVYAKDRSIQQSLMDQFKRGVIKKRYIAFVHGRIKRKGLFDSYIIDRQGKQFGEKKKRAKTYYRLLGQGQDFSVVELSPLTGRTNQLRIQLADNGNPILGERKYAFGRDFKIRFKRLALHAFFISFVHPVSKHRVDLTIDWPSDMKTFADIS